MQGNFSKEALELFNELALHHPQLDSIDMSEGSYDFARCIRPDGTSFGTAGKCSPPNRQAPPKRLKLEEEADKEEREANDLMSGGRRHSRAIQEIASKLMESARTKRAKAKSIRA